MGKKQFKGWGVLAAALIFSFIPTAIMNNCFALYMNPVCSAFGFDAASWSVVNLISSFASAFGAMAIAGLYQKKNMKLILIINSIGVGLCYLVATYCSALWQFYVVFGVANVFLAGLTQLPVSMLITAWFEDRRSTMMSIAFAGTGIGAAIWSPVLNSIISSSAEGWKSAMLYSGIFVTVVMILVALFLVKRSPAEYGTEPYRTSGDKKDDAEQAKKSAAWIGVSKKTATKSKAWIAVIGTVMLVGALASGVTTHVPNFATEMANDGGKLGSLLLSAYSIFSTISFFGGGALMDKIGIKKTSLLAVCAIIVGLATLALASVLQIPVLAYGYCAFAIAMCLPRVIPAVIVSTVFGTKDYAGIFALSNLFFLIGAALGSVLTGILANIGGYAVAWIFYMVVAVLFFLCIAAALRGGEKLKAQYPEGDEVTAA